MRLTRLERDSGQRFIQLFKSKGAGEVSISVISKKLGIPLLNLRLPLLAALAAALLLTAISVFAYFGGTGSQDASKARVVEEAEAVKLPADLINVYKNSETYYNNLDGGYLYVHDNIVDTRRNCEFCTSIDYQPGLSTNNLDLSWAADKNLSISGAKKITFYVMGDSGGEVVKFKAAGKKADTLLNGKKNRTLDFGIVSQPVALQKEWKKFEIDVSKTNMAGVTNPFGIGIEKADNKGPVKIFVKAIVLDDQPAAKPLQVEKESPG
jgi:hypothetical protein